MRRSRRTASPKPGKDDDRAQRRSDAPATQPDGLPGGPHEGPHGSPHEGPSDGDHNQGGARPEGLDYQRDLGTDQDA